jgi:hypothetical protein
MNIPLARQSTFRLTLLPETLDFQPDEQEGGNIILPPTRAPILLQADFVTGSDKRGHVVQLQAVDCTWCGQYCRRRTHRPQVPGGGCTGNEQPDGFGGTGQRRLATARAAGH